MIGIIPAFGSESNLVDVRLSKLRRKLDRPHELSIIRNVRGTSLVLSSVPSMMERQLERPMPFIVWWRLR